MRGYNNFYTTIDSIPALDVITSDNISLTKSAYLLASSHGVLLVLDTKRRVIVRYLVNNYNGTLDIMNYDDLSFFSAYYGDFDISDVLDESILKSLNFKSFIYLSDALKNSSEFLTQKRIIDAANHAIRFKKEKTRSFKKYGTDDRILDKGPLHIRDKFRNF